MLTSVYGPFGLYGLLLTRLLGPTSLVTLAHICSPFAQMCILAILQPPFPLVWASLLSYANRAKNAHALWLQCQAILYVESPQSARAELMSRFAYAEVLPSVAALKTPPLNRPSYRLAAASLRPAILSVHFLLSIALPPVSTLCHTESAASGTFVIPNFGPSIAKHRENARFGENGYTKVPQRPVFGHGLAGFLGLLGTYDGPAGRYHRLGHEASSLQSAGHLAQAAGLFWLLGRELVGLRLQC